MSADRDYIFTARTFDGSFEPAWLVAHRPWLDGLRSSGTVASARVYEKIGDVQPPSAGARDWRWFVLTELAPGADADAMIAGEQRIDAASGVTPLTHELLCRPRGAGTSVPRPGPAHHRCPPNFTAAIEYIAIPEAHWEEYRQFMYDVFGPIGRRLVAKGDFDEAIITERRKLICADPSMPDWNRIHILVTDWSDFDLFVARASAVVPEVLGRDIGMFEALAPAERYRIKPRMTNNRLREDLSLIAR